jgi:D-lactate dehydrogenase (cytochrome)
MPSELPVLEDIDLEGRVVTDPDRRRTHATDYGTPAEKGVLPDVVIYPISTADVSTVLAAANEHAVPVTPYAAGTSIEGNPVPAHGGISLDLTEMNDVHTIHPADFLVHCGPGTIGSDLAAAVSEHDRFFPPFPQSARISTVGGMIANDASGPRTVKYGEVGDWVRELEVVLADGTVITVGNQAVKSSSGYNLRDLVIGSEGTLAVITRAILGLAKEPGERMAGRAVFDDLDAAAEAVATVMQTGIDIATIELMDAATVTISNAYTGADLPDAPMLFVEFHGASSTAVRAELDRWHGSVEAAGARLIETELEAGATDRLLRARREIGHALVAYDDSLRPVINGDVTVPISRYPAMLKYARAVADDLALLIPCFGHAGDGNLHYSVMVDRTDDDQVERAWEASDRIVHRALELEGTCTGEHGIGQGKRRYMQTEHGDDGLAAMRAVKDALDPNGILNPGKIFPDDAGAS